MSNGAVRAPDIATSTPNMLRTAAPFFASPTPLLSSKLKVNHCVIIQPGCASGTFEFLLVFSSTLCWAGVLRALPNHSFHYENASTDWRAGPLGGCLAGILIILPECSNKTDVKVNKCSMYFYTFLVCSPLDGSGVRYVCGEWAWDRDLPWRGTTRLGNRSVGPTGRLRSAQANMMAEFLNFDYVTSTRPGTRYMLSIYRELREKKNTKARSASPRYCLHEIRPTWLPGSPPPSSVSLSFLKTGLACCFRDDKMASYAVLHPNQPP